MASGATVSFLLCPDVVLCVGLAGDSSSASKWWWHIHLGSDNQRTQGHHVGRYYSDGTKTCRPSVNLYCLYIFHVQYFWKMQFVFFNWNDFVFYLFQGECSNFTCSSVKHLTPFLPKSVSTPFLSTQMVSSDHTHGKQNLQVWRKWNPALGEVFFWNSTCTLIYQLSLSLKIQTSRYIVQAPRISSREL